MSTDPVYDPHMKFVNLSQALSTVYYQMHRRVCSRRANNLRGHCYCGWGVPQDGVLVCEFFYVFIATVYQFQITQRLY